MSILPDELWSRIMEIGIESKTLNHKSLCSLSIGCRRLRRLAADDSLWSPLLLSDFPSAGDTNNNLIIIRNCDYIVKINKDKNNSIGGCKFKSLYKIRYEKDREKKQLAHRRAVLRIESEIFEHQTKIQAIKHQYSDEMEKMNNAVAELQNLRRIRQASVALNVWQPEIIRGRQRQMVQQSNVPVDFRIKALEMEINLCRQQIAGFDNALQLEKRRLHAAKKALASAHYHPLQDLSSTNGQTNVCRVRSKKMKHISTPTYQ